VQSSLHVAKWCTFSTNRVFNYWELQPNTEKYAYGIFWGSCTAFVP